ncbi:MAG: hypothetical protein FGM37_10855 [Phycisphaerales bacterium]|nr:hypothetical protein [Phycisphaerales bacterium]
MRSKRVVLVVAAVTSFAGVYFGVGPQIVPAAESVRTAPGLDLALPARVPVRLDGFVPWREWSGEGLHQVRWNNAQFPWIGEPEECRALWESRPACDHPGWEGMSLRRGFDDKHAIDVMTCAEWVAGLNSGRGPMSTYDLSQESFFIATDAVLSAIAHARPSPRSTWSKLDLQTIVYELLPPPVERNTVSRWHDPELAWHISGNTIYREDEMRQEWIEPVVFGDIDGDGWEDMVALSGMYARHGTMRRYGMRAFTRREDGRLIEISLRLPTHMPSDVDRQRQVDAWTANYGLPEGKPIELRGQCDCGDAEHEMRMTITSIGGIVEGEYRCARTRNALRINGCLAGRGAQHEGSDTAGAAGAQLARKGQLTEFGIDDAPTAQLYFDWSIAKGALILTGYRCGTGHMETDDFRVEGKWR